MMQMLSHCLLYVLLFTVECSDHFIFENCSNMQVNQAALKHKICKDFKICSLRKNVPNPLLMHVCILH